MVFYESLHVQRHLSLAPVCPFILYARNGRSTITTVTLSPLGPPALSLSTLIWRYVRQFVKMDAKEALQYVYCVCLSADQGNGVGKENLENAWELARRIIVLAHSGPAWEELVGGFRPDGTKFVCLTVSSLLGLAFLTYEGSRLVERRHRTRSTIAPTAKHDPI